MNKTARIFTLAFWLLCASNFFFSASFQMLIPELPDYLTSLGGAAYKGLIIALFTLTAGISRPFSGKLTDTIGRVPVMVFGSLVCVVCGLLYPMLGTVVGFLILRTFHGFSTGFKPTATAAYVADVVPFERRGEAMSVLGISGSVGMSLGPALGGWIDGALGMRALFYTSAVFALMSVIILVGSLKETLPVRMKFHPRALRISRADVFEPLAFPPFLVMFLLSFASGCVLTIIPDLTKDVGIANKGMFFAVYTLASLAIRVAAGKSSDRYGRVAVLRYSAFAQVGAMMLITLTHSPAMLIAAAVVYGLSWGLNSPSLTAWTVDLVPDVHRGRGLATMFIALEFGIGSGAYLSQWIYDNQYARIFYPFYLSAALSLVAAVYLLRFKADTARAPTENLILEKLDLHSVI